MIRQFKKWAHRKIWEWTHSDQVQVDVFVENLKPLRGKSLFTTKARMQQYGALMLLRRIAQRFKPKHALYFKLKNIILNEDSPVFWSHASINDQFNEDYACELMMERDESFRTRNYHVPLRLPRAADQGEQDLFALRSILKQMAKRKDRRWKLRLILCIRWFLKH